MPRSSARPHDAAALVLIREGRQGPEVLMGRRHADHSFMPGLYVFPGGRLDLADRHSSGFAEAFPPPPPGLDRATLGRMASFARAAVRETYEETGLLLARPVAAQAAPVAPPPAEPVWRAFLEARLAPAFCALSLVARAITPSRSPRRFHTRFFLADGAAARGRLRGSGELEDLGWFPVAAVPRLPIPAEVTELVLAEALAHRRAASSAGASRPAALFRWVRGGARAAHTAGCRPGQA